MKENPTILVCVATYHRLKELKRAIESLQHQTYTNFEAWIVKDGCELACSFFPNYMERTCLECHDCLETVQFVRYFCKTDSRFKFFVLSANFGGHAWGPRNFAILNTEHRLIAYLDDDNWYEPMHLELLHEVLLTKNVDMAFTGSNIYEQGRIVEQRIHAQTPQYGYIDTSEILHHRRLIEKYGGWRDDRFYGANDWDIVKRWIDHNVSFAHTGVPTLNYVRRKKC